MMSIWLVGVGGLVGSMARYSMGMWMQSVLGNSSVPYGTVTVNVVGCFLIGLLAGLAETRQFFGEATRAFVIVGLLGGFTTFSAFGYETLALVRDGHAVAAAANVGIHVGFGLVAVWIGFSISQQYS
jgi:CrcB protein